MGGVFPSRPKLASFAEDTVQRAQEGATALTVRLLAAHLKTGNRHGTRAHTGGENNRLSLFLLINNIIGRLL